MASLPPQRPQRRSSPPQRNDSSADQPPAARQGSQSPSTKSVDSQTLFLNDLPTSSTSSGQNESSQEQARRGGQSAYDEEPHKCWICFSDETEDTPSSGIWRSPCPCALTAHEACLLDWIADMEAPDASRSTAAPKEIRCPQCKSEIFLSRPRSRVVEAVGALEKFAGHMLFPGVLTGITYTFFIGASHHGAHSIRMIFGPDDADAILAPSLQVSWVEQALQLHAPTLARPFFRGWRGLRLELGLPLIPAALIASRTTLADAVLPILPLIFFATHPEQSAELSRGYWPPSAALTLVVLPYVRSIYDEYLERVWGERERQWMKEIRPSLGREDDAENAAENEADGDAEVVEIEVDVDLPAVFGGGNNANDDGAAEPPNIRRERAPDLNAPPEDRPGIAQDLEEARGERRRADDIANRVEADIQQQEQQEPRQQEQQGRQQQQHHHHQNIDIVAMCTRIADTTLGALLFPTISAGMGELLNLVLPAAWTVPKVTGYGFQRRVISTGLLQTRWGRSIIGGCLFVVLKDAVRIYCRWKMAQAFRRRKVLDFDKSKGRVVS